MTINHSMPNFACRLPLVLFTCLLPVSYPTTATESAPIQVFAARVRPTELADRIEALGTLRANESITVTATVSDTISKVHFDDGDRVKAGDLLVELTSEEESALLAEARAALDEALSQHERVASLARIGNESKSLLDQRLREVNTAQARLRAIEAQLADRLIKAPFAGIVGLRYVSPGSLVQPGDEITTLDDDSVMKMELPVPSVYLAALRPGLKVEAVSAAYSGKKFTGSVSAVSSRVDPIDRSVVVRALLPNHDRLLKPGMLMKVVLLANPRSAIVIPESALLISGDRHQVFALSAEVPYRTRRQEVTIGVRRAGSVEIVSGLAAGDLVVTHGVQHLNGGEIVTLGAIDEGKSSLADLLDGDHERETDGGAPAPAGGGDNG